jgi:hypothetical protein
MARVADRITTAVESPGPWSLYIYGDWGAGKSVLGAGFPHTLVAMVDQDGERSFLNHPELAHVPILKIKTLKDLEDLMWDLADDKDERYKDILTVTIDTWTSTQKKDLDAQMKEVATKNNRHPDLPSESEFNINNTRLRKLALAFIEKTNRNIIFLAHVKEEKDDQGTTVLIRPANSPASTNNIAELVSGVFYLASRTDSKGETTRTLKCMPTARIRAKNRFSSVLNAEIKNPTAKDILDAIDKQLTQFQT